MQNQNGSDKEDVGLSRVSSFLRSSTMFYLVMGTVGALVAHFQHNILFSSLTIPSDTNEALRLLLISLLGAAVLLIFNYIFEEQFPSFKAFRHILMQMVGAASIPASIYLAVLSAFGEELLFRAAIQPELGLIGTALLFGLLHLGPQGLISIWTLWAILTGLLFGFMFQQTQSLLPVIVCHILVNTISMLRLRIQYKRFLKAAAKHEAAKKMLSGS
ncbi:MAG: CPBP family intramembrane metalloprotease [Proteobacteria bacterium]|nr:MAG: CPBP family intramembrane metalloprotease [Pseudomonadota bacterium]